MAATDYTRRSLWRARETPLSFPEGVESIDFASERYSIEILDQDNPLLEVVEEHENEDNGTDGEQPIDDGQEAEPEKHEAPSTEPWSITPLDAAEERIASQVDRELVDAKEPAYSYGVEDCGGCGCALDERGLHVDGRLRG